MGGLGEGKDPLAGPDCGHQDYTLGCQRCFTEMDGLVRGQIRISASKAQIEGAMLMIWHVQTVLVGMREQLVPLTRGLDLRENDVAKELMANLDQLMVYFMDLMGQPRKLAEALNLAAVTLQEARKIDAEKRAGTRAATPATGIVLTDLDKTA